MASGALDVFCGAKVVPTVEAALAGTIAAFALTARPREIGPAVLSPREAARVGFELASQGPVAFLFGNEESGLRNEDILRCQRIVEIPANPIYSSLNVAAAVQVIAYELRTAGEAAGVTSGRPRAPIPDKFAAATFEEIEGLYGHFERALGNSGFLDRSNPRKLMERLRRLCGRAVLEREEVNILRGILGNLEAHSAKSGLPVRGQPAQSLISKSD